MLVHYCPYEIVHLLRNIPDITQKCPIPQGQNALRNLSRHCPVGLLARGENPDLEKNIAQANQVVPKPRLQRPDWTPWVGVIGLVALLVALEKRRRRKA